MNGQPDYSHVPGDVRKRLIEQASHDEQHAHEDTDWRADNITVGED